MFSFTHDSILDMFRDKPKGEMEVFGGGSIKLSRENIVHFTLLDGYVQKRVPFNLFRETAYLYSEYMTTPCANLLAEMVAAACINSKENELANENYS